jgi:hypothetical protein
MVQFRHGVDPLGARVHGMAHNFRAWRAAVDPRTTARILRAVSQEKIVMPLSPSPEDPACPSCRKLIKHGTPVVLKFG